MASCLRRLGWLPLLATVACNANRGAPLRVFIAHAAVGGRCYVPGGPQPSDDHLPGAMVGGEKIETLRLTLRTYAPGDNQGNFLCDRVLPVRGNAPSLKIPKGMAQRVDIYAEAFAPLATGDSVPHRVAVGALLGVDVNAATLPPLRLYPDERFRCVDQRLNRPRAFHTATALPNGQVLIVGGLVTGADPNADTLGAAPLFITSDVEVWDPTTASFLAVAETSDTAIPRAFHQAVLVGSDPPYQILLVGGATAAADMPAFGINTGAVPGTRLVPFDTSGTFPSPNMVAAAGAEILSYDPVNRTSTRTPLGGFTPGVYQAAAPFADGVAVAGGIDWMNQPLQAMVPEVKTLEVSRAMEMPPRSAMLTAPRMGATLTALSDDTALLWGGPIVPTDPAGAFVTGLGAQNTVTLTPVTLAAAPPTQFHTATLLPADATTANRTILVTGGFVQTTMNMGQALQPPAPTDAVRLLTVTTTGMVTSAPPTLSGYDMATNPYRPAGWESAVDVGRGRVLVSGGAPTITGSSNDCQGGSDFYCALLQASLFTAPSTLAPTTEPMQLPRYGHTSTLLPDGNVLIVGGIGAPGDQPRLYGDAEVYDPRPVVPEWDPASGNPDPDDPIGARDMIVRAPGAETPGHLCDQL